jgi:endonuclease/exonuclease/phosphatase family metal-dependent hydrolase
MNVRVLACPRFPIAGLLIALSVVFSNARPAAAQDIVLHSDDISSVSGNWVHQDSYSGAHNRKMQSNDYGWSAIDAPLEWPGDYFEATFNARAWTGYRVWLRLKAADNSKWNDSVWVQFSDSTVGGEPAYRIGTSSGLLINLEECGGCGVSDWGWSGHAWWSPQALAVEFPSDGPHTIRIQTREDGVEVDQIVLSSSTYMSSAPGRSRDDSTILPRGYDTVSGPAAPQEAPPPAEQPQPAPPPAPAPAPSPAGGRVRIATWNIHFGGGDPWGQAQAIADSGADVIAIQEASTWDEYMPATYSDRLQQLTGQRWYSLWAGASECGGGCQGTMILSRYPIVDQSTTVLAGMPAARALIDVGGVQFNMLSLHLEYYDTGLRSTQLVQFMEWARSFGGPRIAAGDFNSWWGEWWIAVMEGEYTDTWQDTTGSDENGYTLNGTVRFDYLFRAHDGNWRLSPTATWTQWGSSDHAMLIADYEVR